MRAMTYAEMRKAANHALLSYRKDALRLRRYDPNAEKKDPRRRAAEPVLTEEEIERILRWKRAIDAVRAGVRAEDPLMERFMVRYFALRVPKNRRQPERARHLQLAAELNVADSTLYKWKDSILQRVVAAALQTGALPGAPGLHTGTGDPGMHTGG